jgi:uncharacterized protein with HEPN domain
MRFCSTFYVIGEAVRNIPDEIRDKHPDVDWRQINALRNIIAHVYFGIDLNKSGTSCKTMCRA